MFIQKIFHVHHSLTETKSQLARLQNFRRYLEGVRKATITADGVGQFDCEVAEGVNMRAVVVELPAEEPNQVLFQSTAGNLEVAGLVEFSEVRPDVTEVQLMLEYRPVSLLARLIERCTHRVEHYLERQLRALQGCLDGALSHSEPAATAARFMAHLPIGS